MTRIFLTLAVLDGLALLAASVAGIVSKLRGALLNLDDPTWTIHLSLGLVSALGMGSDWWVGEVVTAPGILRAARPLQTR